jgi:hypothetical protein
MLEALFQLLPAGSAVTGEMLLASSAPLAAPLAVPLAAPTAKLVAVKHVTNMTSDTVEAPPELAALAPALRVAPVAPPRPAVALSLGDSDQAIARPILPPPAPRRRSLVAPLVLLAAAIVGGMVGVGMSRIDRAAAAAAASDARRSTFAAAAPLPPATPEPAPAAVDAGLDASPTARAGTE